MQPQEGNFHFCPVCGGQLNSVGKGRGEPPRLICSACNFVFYLDPKVVACSIVELDGKIALVKRGVQPQKGKWVIPGGYVDRGEEVKTAAIRETEEECGLNIHVKDLLGVYSYSGQVPVVIVYSAELLSGDLTPGDEAITAGWFSENKIPWQNLAFQSTVDALRDYYTIKKRSNRLP